MEMQKKKKKAWMKTQQTLRKKKEGRKTKAKVKLRLHFLFRLSVFLSAQEAGSLGPHIFIYFVFVFDSAAIMLCHEQVSLHINYIYQLVRERTAPDM